MSANPFTKTNTVRNAIKKVAIRSRNLERRPSSGSSGPRISYGSIYGDGTAFTDTPGSGDWESTSVGGNVVVITFDPPFTTRPSIQITPNDEEGLFVDGEAPDFGSFDDYVSGLPLTAVSDDFSTVQLVFYDPDGNTFEVRGFDFEAVGT